MKMKMLHDLVIVMMFLVMVTAPCMAAMSTGVHKGADGQKK